MTSYIRLLLEAKEKKEDKPFNRENYQLFDIWELPIDEQKLYIEWTLKKFKIPVRIRHAETLYKTFYVEVRSELDVKNALMLLSNDTGLTPQGDTIMVGDITYKFIFDVNERRPMDIDGKEMDKSNQGLVRLANTYRKQHQWGKELSNRLFKSNMKRPIE